MSIVFLHPSIPDYAGDGLFHGLRTILGNKVTDYPRMDYMYEDYPVAKWKGVANEGKILYGLLQDSTLLQQQRKQLDESLSNARFIVISQPNGFGAQIIPLMQRIKRCAGFQKIVWVDGSDVPAVFPFFSLRNTLQQQKATLLWPMHRWLYFKREYAGKKYMAPTPLNTLVKRYRIQPLSISIPEQHICRIPLSQKTQDFPIYVVDEEIAGIQQLHHGALGKHAFVFTDEASYWQDISNSRFGITTKRSGWDALRHYEYAAKSAILCFKQLDKKPSSAAPHGLNHSNCIVYQNAKDLFRQLQSLSDEGKKMLYENTHRWAMEHSTKAEAQRFLHIVHHQPLYVS